MTEKHPGHRAWLAEAVRLARRGFLEVEPNPPVGALLVRDGDVVGRGWHRRYGGPHAEVEALADAGARARGADLYVTLEPCSTTGKTPPCTDALAAAGLRRVVFGAEDPDARHRGRAAALLRAAGVEVEGPVDADGECAALLVRFAAALQSARPWVIAKWAMSLDGRIATRGGESRWISGEAARARVHALRGHVDAIAVGRATVELDDPLLTARPAGPRRATRVVFDRRLRLPPDWRALSDHGPPVVVVHVDAAPSEARDRLDARGVERVEVADGDDATVVTRALPMLRERGVLRLLVEGGGALLGAFFDAGAVDQVGVFVAPRVIGGREARAPVAGQGPLRLAGAWTVRDATWEPLGDDLFCSGYVERAPA